MVHMACTRDMVSEGMGAIPANEQPTREDLEGYLPRSKSPEDLAWSDLYPQLCAWMNDREQKRRENRDTELNTSDLAGSMNSGFFNYDAG